MDRSQGEVHKHAQRERGQYPAVLTEQAWPMKDLLYGFTVDNGARVTGNPERAR